VKAAEAGVGIFEMDAGFSTAECKQFAPIAEWVGGRTERTDPASTHNVRQLRATTRSPYGSFSGGVYSRS
jgi:hypothetical protein